MAKAPVDNSRDLKHRISPAGVEWLAGELAATRMRFQRARFLAAALDGLEELELKGRVGHVAGALQLAMPPDFGRAAALLDRAADSPDFEGWMIFPVNEYVARAGLESPRIALPLLSRLTGRWSAEFAIRPFIERHFDLTYRHLGRWIEHRDHHVRRLVTEGTRPRLPWGQQLRALIADPTPSIPLLERLVDDPSEYVRRSVANHLNDIAKDHPQLALKTARRWLGGRTPPPEHRLALVRHGLRTLVKQGDPAALALLGFDPEARISVTHFEVTPAEIVVGDYAQLSLELTGSSKPVPVMIDYVVHFQGANGPRAPKVFKWTSRTIESRPLALSRRHRFAHASIRRLFPGPHRIEIQLNGRIHATTELSLHVP